MDFGGKEHEMEEIVYEGKRYVRYSEDGKWTDSSYMVVPQTLQITLNQMYMQSKDFSDYEAEDLVKEGDRFKNSETYASAVLMYEKAIEICDENTVKYILPRITSCYRALHMPQKAITLFAETKKKYGESFLSAVLLTSVAAAYCDLKEYENALRCCRWAYKNCDGDASGELQSVFGRIRKETGWE